MGMTDPSDPGVSQADAVIIDVVVDHPGSSISEITARAGFTQSHVSASVGRMREQGWFRTSPDPADRRRTLVWAVDALSEAIATREERSAEAILGVALSETTTVEDRMVELDEAKLSDVVAVLEDLHRRLTARALRQIPGDDRRSPERSDFLTTAGSDPPAGFEPLESPRAWRSVP